MTSKSVFTIANIENYSDGQIIFEEGSSGDWVYEILSGSVEISKTVNGQKYVMEVLGQGEVFGELAFIAKFKRTATARAIGETSVGLVDRDLLDAEYNRLSKQFRAIFETTSIRFQKMLARATDFSRRTDARIEKSLSLVIKDKPAFMNAYKSSDVSGGGLFIRMDGQIPVGSRFLLKLQLPGVPQPLQIKCEVKWIRKKEDLPVNQPAGIGVQFIDISKKDHQILKEFIAN